MVLRSIFQDEKRKRDSLGLMKREDKRLLESLAVPRGAKLVFVDATEFPGTVQASGSYNIDGDKAPVSIALSGGEKESAGFTVEGEASNRQAATRSWATR